jgi:hypothetical protein
MRVFGLFVASKESSTNLNGIDTVFTTPFKGARLGGSTDTLREHDRKVVSVRKIIPMSLMRLIITSGSSISPLSEGFESLALHPTKILLVGIVHLLTYPSSTTATGFHRRVSNLILLMD